MACVLAAAGCPAKVIELGPPLDAAIDAPASTCACRITPCRTAGDCTLTGGTCGADFYCTGDFGPCQTTATCQATISSGVCTASPTSTMTCP
jgi:hypothetical protein